GSRCSLRQGHHHPADGIAGQAEPQGDRGSGSLTREKARPSPRARLFSSQQRRTAMNNAIRALNDLNRTLENVLPACNRYRDSATVLELIVGSVADRYIGDLESSEDCHGDVWYLPSDADDIREIMTDLWGKYLPALLREEIAERIIREGWPEGFYI